MKWIRITEPARKGFNFQRKLYHMAGLLVPAFLYGNAFQFIASGDPLITRKVLICLLILSNLALVILETLRFTSSSFRDFFHRQFGFLMKEAEHDRIHGTVAYMVANLILFLFFSDAVIVLSLSFLVLADPLAALVGIYTGRLRFWNGKTLEGMLGFVAGAFVAGLAFLVMQTYSDRAELPFVLISGSMLSVLVILAGAAFLTALAEFFSFTAINGLIDDNIIVPLAAAFSLLLFVWLFDFSTDTVFFDLQRIL